MNLTRHNFTRFQIGDNVEFTAVCMPAYDSNGKHRKKSIERLYLAKKETGKVVGIKRVHVGDAVVEEGHRCARCGAKHTSELVVDRTLYFWQVKRSLLGQPVLVADEDVCSRPFTVPVSTDLPTMARTLKFADVKGQAND